MKENKKKVKIKVEGSNFYVSAPHLEWGNMCGPIWNGGTYAELEKK